MIHIQTNARHKMPPSAIPTVKVIFLLAVLVTSARAEPCVRGPIRFSLQPTCSLEALREAYAVFFDNDLMRSRSCNHTLDEDLAEVLGTSDLVDAAEELCAGADYGDAVPFHSIAGNNGAHESQFDKKYFDGGTIWNEEVETLLETGTVTKRLREDASQVKNFYDGPAQFGSVEWPNDLSNFDLDTCEIHAAMCCWVTDRQANDNNGNCASPYDTGCIDKVPADNADLCATKLDAAPESVRAESDAGVGVHHGDNADGEGAFHCHGMAWSNDPHHFTARYKANNLFYISMYDHLYQRGYVRNVPGAPMCACVEQMPVVTRSDCTQTDVQETYEVTCNANPDAPGCTAVIAKINVDFNACRGIDNRNNNDLSAYFARLHQEGHLDDTQKGALKEILVEKGNCPRAIERNLARAGIVRGFGEGVFAETLEFPEVQTNELVHGICVGGASHVSAYSSDNNLYYTQHTNFTSGQVAWDDRNYVLDGVENTVCAGGIYLQPTRHKTINRFTDIVVGANPTEDYLTICALVEYNRGRDGGWAQQAAAAHLNMKLGPSSGISWVSTGQKIAMTLLCRELPERPSSVPSKIPSASPSLSAPPSTTRAPNPSLPATVSLTLPATTTRQLVHGLCVKGATTATASASSSALSYTPVENFSSGVKAWDDRKYVIDGVEATPCAGGIFMRPNKHKQINKGAVIVFDMKRATSDYMQVCVFAEPKGGRNGGWFQSVPSTLGFTDYGTSFTGFQWGTTGSSVQNQAWGMLCAEM